MATVVNGSENSASEVSEVPEKMEPHSIHSIPWLMKNDVPLGIAIELPIVNKIIKVLRFEVPNYAKARLAAGVHTEAIEVHP